MNYKVVLVSLSLGLWCFALKGMSRPQNELFHAAEEGYVMHLVNALAKGANIEAKKFHDRTALQVAAQNGHQECLRVLLEKGAQIEAKDDSGRTALYFAAQNGRQECLRVLLEKGAQVEAKDDSGRTAFHTAAWHDRLECLKLLIEMGAQIEAKSDNGNSAYHWAAYGDALECLEFLLFSPAHVVITRTDVKILTPSMGKVELSRRRLKVALLSLRYAGSEDKTAKYKNEAGDLIVSNEYVRPWFLLSHSGVREDVFTVLLNLLSNGGNVNYALFRLAHVELGDYLVIKLRDWLTKVNASKPIASVRSGLDTNTTAEIAKFSDPNLVEENFGDLIRNGIKARFDELLRTPGACESAASSVSTFDMKKQTNATNR